MKKNYLYVLLLPHMDEEYNLTYKIKFGFSENFDNRLKNGYESYYGKESVKVLHIYEGDFTKEDETTVKQYLKKYCLFGEEWFKCCQEVLEFFNENDTSEKLKNKIDILPKNKSRRKHYEASTGICNYVDEKVFMKEEPDVLKRIDLYEKLKNVLSHYPIEDQIKYVSLTYGLGIKDVKLHSNVFVNYYVKEFLKLDNQLDRFGFVVDVCLDESISIEDFYFLFLEQIPEIFNRFGSSFVIGTQDNIKSIDNCLDPEFYPIFDELLERQKRQRRKRKKNKSKK